MLKTVAVTLSPENVAELEPLAAETHESFETIVNDALAEYVRLWERRKMREQLARQYEELAAMWDELAEDLASEKWLPVENEALQMSPTNRSRSEAIRKLRGSLRNRVMSVNHWNKHKHQVW